MHKLIAIYNTPADPEAFRRHLEEVHLPLVAKFPGLHAMRHGFDVSSPEPVEFHAVVECEFDNEAMMQDALSSPEGAAAAADVPNYAAAGVTILTYAVAPALVCETKLGRENEQA